MIKPTVGRVVWYRPNAHDDLYGSDQPLAAHVAYVWSDTMVNLMVIDHNGGTHPRTSVVLRHGESSPPGGQSYCEWMPYQKGQAAKAEALEQKLGAGA